jgi:hypothetical protein
MFIHSIQLNIQRPSLEIKPKFQMLQDNYADEFLQYHRKKSLDGVFLSVINNKFSGR